MKPTKINESDKVSDPELIKAIKWQNWLMGVYMEEEFAYALFSKLDDQQKRRLYDSIVNICEPIEPKGE